MVSDASIKNNIRLLRIRLGLSQEQMGAKLGMSRTSYRKLETGETTLVHSSIFKIAEIACVPAEEILSTDLSVPSPTLKLSSPDDSDDRIRTLREDYERRLSEKDETIARLNGVIADKSDLIETQKSFIGFLCNRSSKEKPEH